jgi:hypothetical protein
MATILRRLLLVLLCTILCGVVFHAPLSVGLGTLFPDGQLIIKAWKELLILVALVLVAIEVTKRSMWQTLWNDMVIRLSALFVFLHFA